MLALNNSTGETVWETVRQAKISWASPVLAEVNGAYQLILTSDPIVAGYNPETGEYGSNTKPIEWVRIHNLPDLAYFNHAQHVQVGGLECQTCHGPIEEMEVVYQHSNLTMGWCINCHKETNVKVADNDYYEKIHEALSKKYGVENLTAAQLGGLECGKCHY